MDSISIIEPIGGHGGMDYYDFGLAYGLGQNDIKVHYFTSNATVSREFENVVLHTTFEDVWYKTGVKRAITFLYGYWCSFSKSNKERTSVFHFHFFSLGILNLTVLILALFFKQKKVVTLHDVSPFALRSNRLLEQLCFLLMDAVIVHNKTSEKELLLKKMRLPKIKIIPHGNYLPFIDLLPPPKTEETIKLLFFGQIKEVKGLDILLKAMAKVVRYNTNFHLTIAGRPWKTDGEKYTQMIADLGLEQHVECQFRYINDKEVKNLYSAADVVILPYKKIYQSGVLLLSLSYGRIVIVSDLPPFMEIIIDNNNGFVFESKNVDALANSILKLEKKSILKMTENLKEVITNEYDWVNIGKYTKSFYQGL